MQARAQASGQQIGGAAPADDDDEIPELIENFDVEDPEKPEPEPEPATKANGID